MGVMIDDLVTRGITEPYRMFTSRAEYRLSLRADNADQRLTPLGISAGCVGSERAEVFAAKTAALKEARARLTELTMTPAEAARHGISVNQDGIKRSAFDLLAYPDIGLKELAAVWPELGAIPAPIAEQVATDAQYAVYLKRQQQDIEALRRDEALELSPELEYAEIPGLSTEVRQKLSAVRPVNLAQAARIDGVTPAALTRLLSHVKRKPRLSGQRVA
jgi:tRNA uridine 5-carboxymethylaminomethyl modification enzyme